MEYIQFFLNMDTPQVVSLGGSFFIGLTLGWFCRTGSIFKIIFGMIFLSFFLFAIYIIDFWWMNFAFILGFLVHTAKPLYLKLTS